MRRPALHGALLAGLVAAAPCPLRADHSLSFTLVSYARGELHRSCAAEVERGRALGFGAVTLVPGLAYDAQRERLIGRTWIAGELFECLDRAWRAGLDVLFAPHLDSRATLAGHGEREWRGDFRLAPDRRYEELAFDELFAWLAARRGRVAASGRAVDLLLASELDRSVARYPAAWRGMLARLRARLAELGLGRVRLGLQLNWWPPEAAASGTCTDLRRLLGSLDFVAASFYGDLRGCLQPGGFERRRLEVLTALSGLRADGSAVDAAARCVLPELWQRPFVVGELASGGDLAHAERPVPHDARSIVARRALLAEAIRWAAARPSPPGERRLPLVLWTVGLFDPVGVSSHGLQRRVDPAITAWIQGRGADR